MQTCMFCLISFWTMTLCSQILRFQSLPRVILSGESVEDTQPYVTSGKNHCNSQRMAFQQWNYHAYPPFGQLSFDCFHRSILPFILFNSATVYCRDSQSLCYWHFYLDNSLFCGVIMCIIVCLISVPDLSSLYSNSIPQVWQPTMSPGIGNVPWKVKLPLVENFC